MVAQLFDEALPMQAFAQPEACRRGSDPDWAGLWFQIVEESTGEFVGMRGGRLDTDGSVVWTFVPHATYDGLGGFVELLRRLGTSSDVPVRRTAKPDWIKRAAAFLQLVLQQPRTAAKWKAQGSDWKSNGRPAPGSAIATHLFSVERTTQFVARSRAIGVPLNCLLLGALNRAAQFELKDGPAIWMMPVNMRGPVALRRDTSNQTGYLQIELEPEATEVDVHHRVKERLRRREHWASWDFLNLGRLVGYSGMRRIYALQMSRFENRMFVGSFTNLGVWRDIGQWFVCPPVTMSSPVGAGAIVCNGQLSLTLEAHPSMIGGAAWAHDLVARWIEQLDHRG
jgi:hypothetical protein